MSVVVRTSVMYKCSHVLDFPKVPSNLPPVTAVGWDTEQHSAELLRQAMHIGSRLPASGLASVMMSGSTP